MSHFCKKTQNMSIFVFLCLYFGAYGFCISFQLTKKVRGGCELPEADTQKPYTPKCGQGKTKIDPFRDFFTKVV
jgi:hypothetical protein